MAGVPTEVQVGLGDTSPAIAPQQQEGERRRGGRQPREAAGPSGGNQLAEVSDGGGLSSVVKV
jgi:hypothetical protein